MRLHRPWARCSCMALLACLSPLQTVLTILILTRLVAHFGTNALAGYGIGTRLEFLLVPIAFAVGVASVPRHPHAVLSVDRNGASGGFQLTGYIRVRHETYDGGKIGA